MSRRKYALRKSAEGKNCNCAFNYCKVIALVSILVLQPELF